MIVDTRSGSIICMNSIEIHDAPSQSRRWYRTVQLTLVIALLALPVTGALITFISVVRGAPGIGGVNGLALSPGEEQLYAIGRDDNSVVVFNRDDHTGRLTFVELHQEGSNGVFGMLGVSGVATSPDGRHVYVTADIDDTLVPFARDASQDALTFLAAQVKEDGVGQVYLLDGASAVTVSPDNGHVFVTARGDDALTIFARDASTDDLTYVDYEGLLYNPSDVAVSPDNLHVYVTSESNDAILVFDRDPASGQLSHAWTVYNGSDGVEGIDGASAIIVSPDGLHVYATGSIDNAVAAFSRDAGTGALTFLAVYRDGEGDITNLRGPADVVIGERGQWLIVSSRHDNAIVLFARDTGTGELSLEEARVNPTGSTLHGLTGVAALTLSASEVYTASPDDDSIGAYTLPPIFADGFESGDTSAWTTTVAN